MRLIAIGDSITRGTFVERFENGEPVWGVAQPTFAKLVQEALGFDELINYGSNGIAVSSVSQPDPSYALCAFVDETEAGDCVILACGTNDYGNYGGVPLGSPEDKTDVSFYGGLFVLYSKIKKKYGDKVFVLTPIRRVYEREKNEKGFILEDYREAIETRAKAFGFHCIDGTKIAIDPNDSGLVPDGLHPGDKGHKRIADSIIRAMKENGL